MTEFNLVEVLQQVAEQIKDKPPEEQEAIKRKLLSAIPSEQLTEIYKQDLAGRVVSLGYCIEGYKAYYELIYGFAPPLHVIHEAEKIINSGMAGIGIVLFAWRGSWKTVSISETFLSWFIGLFPKLTNLVICANDDSAEKITKAVAAIIEFHPEWKRVFPNVIPDTGRWSVEGFSVIDSSVSREEWARFQAAVIDPTFVGGGYKSSRLNGKHPTGLLINDDLHDRENSSSKRERETVVDIVLKVILKTAVKDKDKLLTTIIDIGTPWAEDDAHHVLKKSGEFEFVNIPAAVRATEDESGAIYCDGKGRNGAIYDDIVGWWIFTWPKGYGLGSFITDRATLGKAAFWQMIMLDLTRGTTEGLRYYTYPHDDIKMEWPTQGGADPAFTMKERHEISTRTSAFSLAYLSKKPSGGGVVRGGVVERCNPNQAANHIAAAQAIFPNWLFTAIENVGMGLLFIQTVRQINPKLILIPSDLGGIRPKGEKAGRAKSKHDKILYELAPFLESADILISDADDKYLNTLRDGLDHFHELDPEEADERWDVLDSLYHAVKAMPSATQTRVQETYSNNQNGASPFKGFGTYTWINKR